MNRESACPKCFSFSVIEIGGARQCDRAACGWKEYLGVREDPELVEAVLQANERQKAQDFADGNGELTMQHNLRFQVFAEGWPTKPRTISVVFIEGGRHLKVTMDYAKWLQFIQLTRGV